LWIQHGPLVIGPSGINTQACIYETDQILNLPDEDSLPTLRPFVQLWKNALQQLTLALVRPMFYGIRTHGTMPAVLHEDLTLIIKTFGVDLHGYIRKLPVNYTDTLHISYGMVIESPFFDPDTFNDPAFASAVEVCGEVFNVDGRATAAFLWGHKIKLWLNLEASHRIQLFGEPGDAGGSLFVDSTQ